MPRPTHALAALFMALSLTTSPSYAGLFGGDSPPARIPVPARNFSATITDKSNVTVEASRFTFNGEVFLYGMVGEGQVTVPFEQIQVADFTLKNEEYVSAHITLKTGEQVDVLIEKELPFYGKAVFGNYMLPIEKAKRLKF